MPDDEKNADQTVETVPDKGLNDPALDPLWETPDKDTVPADDSDAESPPETEEEEGGSEEAEDQGKESSEEEEKTEEDAEEDTEESESEDEEEEDKEEINLDVIEDEDLREKIRQELEKGRQALEEVSKLSERVDQLGRKVGEQGAEMGALRKQHEQAMNDRDAKLAELNKQRVEIIRNIEAQIEQAKENEDDFTRIELQDQLESYKQQFNTQRWQIVKSFADETEESFLSAKGNEHYREVKNTFEDFIKDLGLEVITIKSDPKFLAKFYDTHYRAVRGHPDNIEKIMKEAKKAKLKSAARIKNAGQPGAGSRKSEPQPKKQDTSGVDWDTTPTSGGIL